MTSESLPEPSPFTYGIPATSYIDINSFTIFSSNQIFAYFAEVNFLYDYDSSYTVNFSDHTGGNDIFGFNSYGSHTWVPEPPYPWERTTETVYSFSFNTTWNPSATNGLRTESGCVMADWCAAPPYYVPRPDVFGAKIVGLSEQSEWGATNSSVESGGYDAGYLQADMQLHLHVGAAFSNSPFTFVLLSASADSVNDITQYDFTYLPIGSQVVELGAPSPLSFSNITLLGQPLNADGKAFFQMRAGAVSNATPTLTGATNYFFNVWTESHKKVTLTRAYHPLFDVPPFSPPPNVPTPTLSNLQARFNSGSLLLSQDDDEKIPDSDPSVAFSTNANSLYRSDDVPLYVEFQIANRPVITNVLTRRLSPVFPAQFNHKKYYEIKNPDDAIEVGSWTGANIKQVKSMFWGGETHKGITARGVKPALMVLVHDAGADTCVHEWGHSCGLYHRNELSTNNVNLNPGPNTLGIMCTAYSQSSPRNKINRYERGLMQGY